MKVVWGNTFDTSNNYRAYAKKATENSTGHNAAAMGNAMFNKDSVRAQMAEMKLREAEDKLLEQYRAQITEIEASGDDDKTKEIKIATVTEQIKQIEEARAQREREAQLKELEKQKAEAEKRKKESGKQTTNEDNIEENGINKEDAEGMVKLSVSYESIKELARTKSMVKSEAKQLEIDIDNDFGVTKYARVKTGHMTPGDFKHRQLDKLNKGISGIDQALASEVRELMRIAKDSGEHKTEKAEDKDRSEQEPEAENIVG